MKVLLYNTRTGFYFTKSGHWVKEMSQAQDFERAPAAMLRAAVSRLSDVELVYSFPNPQRNIRIPLAGFSESARPAGMRSSCCI